MELILNLEKAELAELAKMIYIAQFVVDSSGIHSDGYKYPHFALFKTTQSKVNEALLKVIADTGLVMKEDAPGLPPYDHTIKMENEMYAFFSIIFKKSTLQLY